MVGERAQHEIEMRVAERMAQAVFSTNPARRFVQRTEIIEIVEAEVGAQFLYLPAERHLAREYELHRRREDAARFIEEVGMRTGGAAQPEAG